jgi:peptidoglycan/LPS O-acetylase OafA/YrhL
MANRKQEKHPTRNFFLRRLFRIAPMYYLGILFYSLWFTLVQPRPSITTSSVLANLTFLHGLNPYWINGVVPGGWSITVEIWFYCLAPWLFTRIKTIDQCARFIAAGIAVSSLLSFFITPLHLAPEENTWGQFLFFYFPNQLPIFGFGIMLYLLLANDGQSKKMSASTYLLVAGVALSLLSTGLPYPTESVTFAGQHFWFAAAFVVLAIALSLHAPRALVNPIINYIGEISFSLYLVHFAVLYTLQVLHHEEFLRPTRLTTALLDFGIRYLIVLGISIMLATVFYRLIEIPFQNLGKKLIAYLER